MSQDSLYCMHSACSTNVFAKAALFSPSAAVPCKLFSPELPRLSASAHTSPTLPGLLSAASPSHHKLPRLLASACPSPTLPALLSTASLPHHNSQLLASAHTSPTLLALLSTASLSHHNSQGGLPVRALLPISQHCCPLQTLLSTSPIAACQRVHFSKTVSSITL